MSSRLGGLFLLRRLLCVVIIGICALRTGAAPAPECYYKDRTYSEGQAVLTDEPCLRCHCLRGSLVCYLRVCPVLPDPPPIGCILVLRRGACCSELRCEDPIDTANHIGRADIEGGEIDTPRRHGQGCILGGSLFASGSALSSSTDCQHCFCINGQQKCVQPKCLLPLDGCLPVFNGASCCPSSYDCENAINVTSSTTHAPTPFSGCTVGGEVYNEGEQVTGIVGSPCDKCFCMKGVVRCMPMSCAPPLLGCKPVILPGQCCAHSYKCDDHSNKKISEELLEIDKEFYQTNSIDRSLHSSKPVRYKEEPRITREVTTERNISSTDNTAKSKTKKIDDTVIKSTLNKITTHATPQSTTTANKITTVENSTVANKNIAVNVTTEYVTIALKENNLNLTKNETINDSTTKCPSSSCNNTTVTTTIDDNSNANISSTFSDVEEKHASFADEIEAEQYDVNASKIQKDADSDLQTAMLNIPKNSDFFMVNVSTFVRTNETAMKAKTTTNARDDIEELINKSLKNKEDDFEYDYNESSLPPSLPNLKIIPFVAADAVVETAERDNEVKLMSSPNYVREYPSYDRDGEYQDVYKSPEINQTKNEYIHNPTAFPVYHDDKYLTNPYTSMKYNGMNHIFPKEYLTTKPPTTQDLSLTTEYPGSIIEDIETQFPMYDYNPQPSSLFSPPVETEGGFLPKEPLPGNEYYVDKFTVSYIPDTPSTVFPKIQASARCIINGEYYKHGELITTSNSCKVCICFYGDIQCDDLSCPDTKPGCIKVDKSSDNCCGTEICEDPTEEEDSTTRIDDLVSPSTEIEPTEAISSGDTSTESSSENTTKYSIIETTALNTTELNKNVYSEENLTEISATEMTMQNITKYEDLETTTMAISHDEYDVNESEEDDDAFSFGNVLKLLLGDSYDGLPSTTKKRPTEKPILEAKPQISTRATEKIKYETSTLTTTTTTANLDKEWRTSLPLMRPVLEIPIDRVTINNEPFNQPNKFTTSLPLQSTTSRNVLTSQPSKRKQSTKIMYNTYKPHTTTTIQTIKLERPPNIAHNPLAPFANGLLKLAGCNIYGRMYRVGRIISELSGPCIECMCTEVGVQCTHLKCL